MPLVFAFLALGAFAAEPAPPADPALSSDFQLETVAPSGAEADLGFCEEWNPEFAANGMRCCGYGSGARRPARGKPRCDSRRNRHTYCSEITEEQHQYMDDAAAGKIPDMMAFLAAQVQHRPFQAFCSVNTGFLVGGRAIVPSAANGIRFRSPERCTSFGTEPMAAMVEWLGHQIQTRFSANYPGIHLLLGDISAPRGGCMAAQGGKRGHLSHSAGQDIDIGFVTPRKGSSPDFFHRDLQTEANWWFLKQLFHNPYACIKVVFLDRRQIAKLGRYAHQDPEWVELHHLLRHIKGHRDHFHVRIGDGPGQPGCALPNTPDDDDEDSDFDSA